MVPSARRQLASSKLLRGAPRTSPTKTEPRPDAVLKAFIGFLNTFFHRHTPPRFRPNPTMFPCGVSRPCRRGWRSQLGRTAMFASTRCNGGLGSPQTTRNFHNYFVTHLPSSSLHPDSRPAGGLHHKIPRSALTPHTPAPGSSPAVVPPNMASRNLTVVRVPLRSAKHHFGAFSSRGSREYNEDTNQAGIIDMPAFAKRAPVSLVRPQPSKLSGEGINADSAFGDPQIFYFAVFDGHGGSECSEFLRDELHGYVEEAAAEFRLPSSLRRNRDSRVSQRGQRAQPGASPFTVESRTTSARALGQVNMSTGQHVKERMKLPSVSDGGVVGHVQRMEPLQSEGRVPLRADVTKAVQLETDLVKEYRETVGGYFRRFSPIYFHLNDSSRSGTDDLTTSTSVVPVTIETVLSYAFLRADLDFITAQARKPDPDDPCLAEFPLNRNETLGQPPHMPPSGHGIGGHSRFKGGSTASVALISTPTPAPFWHPAAHSTLVVAHVGDTRILLCETATGLAQPLTVDHHPSSPTESRRLTRYAADSLVTDSFGEERISGLANSRAFGDMQSKRVGVSAEPDITRVDLGPAQYSFLVLMSDGISGSIGDQEIVDVIKEARTPDEGARQVVEYATEISADGDNATCLVVRLGGWERRSEGGLGSLGTKEIRDTRKAEAMDPRRGRR